MSDSCTGAARSVLDGAFDVLGGVRTLGSAHAAELARHTGLARTTVRRLLGQLEQVGAVERTGARWRVGPTVLHLGATIPAEPRLPFVARRPLVDLTRTTGEQAGVSIGLSAGNLVVDVIPAERPQMFAMLPGEFEAAAGTRLNIDARSFASRRAQNRAVIGDVRPVVDAGENLRGLSCVAVAVKLPGGEIASVWSMVPGNRMPPSVTQATRRAALSIAAQLPTA